MNVQFCGFAASKASGDPVVMRSLCSCSRSGFKNGESSKPSGLRDGNRKLHVESDLQEFVEY